MKRDVSLQPLSWQHHDTLMACLMIEKGVRKKTDLKVLQDFTRQLWDRDINAHFLLEENHLVPYLRQKQFPEYIIQSLLRDHELLRVLSQRVLNGGASYEGFLAFSKLLEKHVRFEERLVFEKVQELIPENELRIVGSHFPSQPANTCKSYPVKFWE
ncbi:MAG TPA: hemerythrin domain-containing protein [Chitinophagaceae bacterium]